MACSGDAVWQIPLISSVMSCPVTEIARGHGKALFVPTDVTVEEEVAHLVEVAVQEFGGLHGAFNNAGGGTSQGAIRDINASFWDSVIALNLTSVFYSLKYEIPAIVASGGGSIVNNASVVGVVGDPSAAAYSAAKHGALVTGLVNTPLWRGVVESSPEAAGLILDKQPTGRAADEAEIAAFAAFLLSDESPFINGAALAIDGALTAGY
ncbi:SDR family oxidoreductase [Streptomyces sp. MI02-2A]|uniref:SDR family NAD(P)-dependent oxidoreductase n=1 Tax=unclassified Streptomyces TaxID=2593676 RepID=UPI000E3A6FBE|nr:MULTISPECIES: SDR family oxidoreductase [unclassified Streptomyces]MDX3263283.1 SDR family oxidoreductase [Streptomyces sp. MI02-2A]REE65559.1 NAD(P)-dependent dehydrogenase (short-subunit alcohol dehydrogenase family) [Streptomyces sp. 3212.3]